MNESTNTPTHSLLNKKLTMQYRQARKLYCTKWVHRSPVKHNNSITYEITIDMIHFRFYSYSSVLPFNHLTTNNYISCPTEIYLEEKCYTKGKGSV